jgi:hypothetical protein
MRLESSQHLESRRDDPHHPIVTPKKETFRSRAYAAYFIVFEKCFTIIVGGFDLADVEEIEGFPLSFLSRFSWCGSAQFQTYRIQSHVNILEES